MTQQPDFYGFPHKHGCFYVLVNGTQCGKPVNYIQPVDDAGERHRDYAAFCDEHMIKAKEMEVE